MSLPPDQFKCWQILQWIAGEHDKDGLLPHVSECAFIMHNDPERVETMMYALMNRGLLHLGPDGFRLHDWLEWQARKPSDEPERVRERVARSRATRKPVVTPGNAIHNVTDNVTPGNARNAVKSESENRGELKERDANASLQKSAGRIPDKWPATDDLPKMLAFGEGKKIHANDVIAHIHEYHDYWGQAERNATSLDWVKRWRARFAQDVREGKIGGKNRTGYRPVTFNEQKLKNTIQGGDDFLRLVAAEEERNGRAALQAGDGSHRPRIRTGHERGEAISLLPASQRHPE